jgi:hypothetical protein
MAGTCHASTIIASAIPRVAISRLSLPEVRQHSPLGTSGGKHALEHGDHVKRFNSPIFGEILMPASFAELIDAAQVPVDGQNFNVRIWRGQADVSWPLHSGAYRRLARVGGASTRTLGIYERGLLDTATHRGLRVHEGKALCDLELLARLQHHGAATRLVDATRSCLVALYFACDGVPDKIGLLAGFHTSFLGGMEGRLQLDSYEEVMDSIEEHQYPQTWEPPVVTPRIAAQHSQFLYSSVSDDMRGSLWVGQEPGALLAFAISPALKVAALQILSDTFDIRYSTLFPDLQGFCYLNSTRFGPHEHERW